MNFESLFTDEHLVGVLARMRVKAASSRRKQNFLGNISPTSRRKAEPPEIISLFPPRSQWLRPPANRRTTRKSESVTVEAILGAVYRSRFFGGVATSPWATRLRDYCENIRTRALVASDFELSAPTVVPVPKDREGNLYRPIAMIKDIREAVIVSQTAKYLRQCFDPDFLPSSYAFRCSNAKKTAPSHHDAIQDLAAFRKAHKAPLWVAECDIKGFFDVVNHDVAWKAFLDACKRAGDRGQFVDPRAISLFRSSLHSYSFAGTAEAQAAEFFDQKRIPGKLKSPWDSLEALYSNPRLARIGIPQGGAISCVIANLVLHTADEALHRFAATADAPVFYARYCDDMIIVSPSDRVCATAFRVYCEKLEALRLPAHEPRQFSSYDAAWWTAKSRAPYPWQSRCLSGVPWVGFLGYQIRFDGLMRVRPDSIRKELAKQQRIAFQLARELRADRDARAQGKPALVHRSAREVIHRFRQKTLAMSVGTRSLEQRGDVLNDACWAAGFKALASGPLVISQLRRLDAGRERQIRRIIYHSSHLPRQGGAESIDKSPQSVRNFYGYPYSYAYCFRPRTSDAHRDCAVSSTHLEPG